MKGHQATTLLVLCWLAGLLMECWKLVARATERGLCPVTGRPGVQTRCGRAALPRLDGQATPVTALLLVAVAGAPGLEGALPWVLMRTGLSLSVCVNVPCLCKDTSGVELEAPAAALG